MPWTSESSSETRARSYTSATQRRQSCSGLFIGPGGHTGWHSHPGPAIALVKNGQLTLYSSEDPACTGRPFGAGQAFVDSGQGHVHMATKRDEPGDGSLGDLSWMSRPAAPVRIDAGDPGNCVF